jgi:hypothetical protein
MTERENRKLFFGKVARATATDLDTGEVTELTTREGSGCLFLEGLSAGQYEVQLRVDFTTLDKYGHPVLQADFRDPVTRKHVKKMARRRHPAHHADSQNTSERTYEWTYEEVTRRFAVAVTWSATGFAAAVSGATAEATAIHPPLGEP